MSIMDMFRGKPGVPQTNQQNQPGQPPGNNQQSPNSQPGNTVEQNKIALSTATNENDKTAPNGTVPKDSQESPLAKFEGLWDTPTTDPATAPKSWDADLTPQKLMEAAGKVDFKRIIKPEQLEAIKAGGDAGVTAFADVINTVTQVAMAQSAQNSMGLIKKALESTASSSDARVKEEIRKHTLGQSTYTENPALKNPAFKVLVDGTQDQMRRKYPEATDDEVRKMTSEYFDTLNQTMNPKKVEAVKETPENKDWDKYFSLDKQEAA